MVYNNVPCDRTISSRNDTQDWGRQKGKDGSSRNHPQGQGEIGLGEEGCFPGVTHRVERETQ